MNVFLFFFLDKCVQTFLKKLFGKCNQLQNHSGKNELFIPLEVLGEMS